MLLRSVLKQAARRSTCGATASHRSASAIAGDPELEPIKEGVRDLCAGFPGEYWRDLDSRSEYPTAFVSAMSQAGYLGMLIPEEHGGTGNTLREACAVLETVHASGCNGGAAHAQMYTMGTVLRHGSDAQKARFLPKIADGSLRLQAFGVSEPNNGTDTLRLETTAKLAADGTHYVISGQKMWTSRAEHSDLMLCLARTAHEDDGSGTPRSKCLSMFIVDMQEQKARGALSITPVETMMNHSTTALFMDGMVVPAENRVGGEGEGFKCVLTSMNAERLLIAAECIGDGRYFVARAVAYAKEREVFGRPIGQNQGIQFPIAAAYAKLEAAALMVERGARMYDEGASHAEVGALANMAKMLAADASWECSDVCMQTHGGYGFAKEYDIERKFRETRLYRVAPISTNLILSFVAEKVLGMPRSY